MLVDATCIEGSDYSPQSLWPEFVEQLPKNTALTLVLNKIDLVDGIGSLDQLGNTVIPLSAKTGIGVDTLRNHLKSVMGYIGEGQSSFTARQRHIEALRKAQQALNQGREQLVGAGAGELLAEDLRLAQEHLGEITGRFTSDDLLGRIFSSFCIGK